MDTVPFHCLQKRKLEMLAKNHLPDAILESLSSKEENQSVKPKVEGLALLDTADSGCDDGICLRFYHFVQRPLHCCIAFVAYSVFYMFWDEAAVLTCKAS